MFKAITAAVLAGLFALVPAFAQDYPARPIKLVVPYAPGGATDAIGRALAVELSKGLGQQVVVENRPGASGAIGMQAVAAAPPDGHTLMLMVSTITQMPSTNKSLKLDIARDFKPITIPFSLPIVIFSHPTQPYSTLSEMVAYIQKNRKVSYATSGPGSPGHIAFAVLNEHLKADMVHIPYKGGAESTAATASGDVPIAVAAPQPGIGWAREGRIRMLGVVSAKRSSLLPEIPSLGEVGAATIDMRSWLGLFAPGGTPSEIVARLHKEVTVAVKSEALISKARATSTEMETPNTPAEFAALIDRELKMWPEVFSKVKLD